MSKKKNEEVVLVEEQIVEQTNTEKNKKQKIKISKKTKKSIKVKKQKEKKNFKLAIKEFPIKIVKELNKIKWSGWDNLKKKYIIVLLFMIFFAILFFCIGLGIEALFRLINVY
ncbi:preprotein translocase subunit SecE [Mesoplasma florum]|uniref:preprotein translocase subunit SecE n=1 Tax=Mesoplasma florum TaxID=2151 RepID=UPI000BE3F1B7|nr:preprotein translocase subunit SecE [Mesoplasma florum]ATI73048.1 preprotein translocase subunit SecE [Mesoplasma florum]AVN61451.1 preprotein translocase subunit SecE [Mesoplasma florum]